MTDPRPLPPRGSTPTPYPRPRPPQRSFQGRAWWIVLALVAVWIAVLAQREPASTPATVTPPPRGVANEPAPTPRPAATVDLDDTDGVTEARIAALELSLIETKQQLEAARDEARRYREGLDRAVDELNRLQAGRRLEAAEQKARSARARSGASDPAVMPLGAPFVTVTTFGSVIVSGDVRNQRRWNVRGLLEVSIQGPEGVISTMEVMMDIEPGGSERYDVTFWGIFPNGPVGASAQWAGS